MFSWSHVPGMYHAYCFSHHFPFLQLDVSEFRPETPFTQRLLRAKLRHRPKETAVGKCWLRWPFSEWFFVIFNPWRMVWITVTTVSFSHDVWSNFLDAQLLNLFCLFHHIGARPSLKILRWTYAFTVNSWHHFVIARFFFSITQSCWGSGALTTKCCWGQAAYRPPTCYWFFQTLKTSEDLWKHTALIVDKSHWQVWDGMSMKTYEMVWGWHRDASLLQ